MERRTRRPAARRRVSSSSRRAETRPASAAIFVETPGARVALAVVRVVETRLGHVAPGLRRMHELALAGVDPDVAHIAATRLQPEEDEVTRAQVALGDPIGRRELGGRRAGHTDAFACVHPGDEATAVEAPCWIGSAPSVGHAELRAGFSC